MIVSVFVIRDFFVSMTELPKNLRTSKAAFSSGIPDVSSIELDLLAGCGFVEESVENGVLVVGWMVRNRVAVLVRLLKLLEVTDWTVLFFRTPGSATIDSVLTWNLLTKSSTFSSVDSGASASTEMVKKKITTPINSTLFV